MSYWGGFFTGIVAVACCVLAGFAATLGPSFAVMYADFGAVEMPASTRLVLSPAWAPAILTAVVAAALMVNLRWPWSLLSRTITLAVIALVALALVAFTTVAAYLPITEVAGDIRVD